ncbi:MAG: hypothetical protein JWL59_1379 [Chthoniobacteraceae bacterium]|nr:hypothetical protein [Chthoniobacteraceae bacterium]
MQLHLKRVFLAHLREVLEARKEWQVAELFLKASAAFIRIMKGAPAALLPQLEASYRDQMGHEFEPTPGYRQSELDAEKGKSEYRNALRGFKTDSTEHVTQKLPQRLPPATASRSEFRSQRFRRASSNLKRNPTASRLHELHKLLMDAEDGGEIYE